MINTILFDLDGTVLPMDFDQFMRQYFINLGIHFKDKIDPNLLVQYVRECSDLMIGNDTGNTNEEVFMAAFEKRIGHDITEYKEMFSMYYDTLFQRVQATTYPSKEMIESVKILQEKGYTIVLATNPLFPMKANHHRVRWAGLTPEDFSYISAFEMNHYCKPNAMYFEEVLQTIQKKPEECMMIGNDVVDDLGAMKLGIKTYIITDCIVNRNNIDYHSDYKGNYQDFLQFVKALKPII
ncbi:MAG: HAD hydrolase-like protein [Bacilli bacterium]|nr:HAD hydrolase-like protein [Bacilli bacterium]